MYHSPRGVLIKYCRTASLSDIIIDTLVDIMYVDIDVYVDIHVYIVVCVD